MKMKNRTIKLGIMLLLNIYSVIAYAQTDTISINSDDKREMGSDLMAVKPMAEEAKNEGVPEASKTENVAQPASARNQIVLLIGDSMAGRLAPRFNDYAEKNGFEFHSIVWNGSTTRDWAIAADLQYQVEKLNPTYVLISLGTNDLGYRDYQRRANAIQTILSRVENIPYTWIGPLPMRKFPNRAIVDIIEEQTGRGRFFDSSEVYAARVDGIHPTWQGAADWADDIVDWLGNPALSDNPMLLERPDTTTPYQPDEQHSPGYHGRR